MVGSPVVGGEVEGFWGYSEGLSASAFNSVFISVWRSREMKWYGKKGN
jgi:hypothetical protein